MNIFDSIYSVYSMVDIFVVFGTFLKNVEIEVTGRGYVYVCTSLHESLVYIVYITILCLLRN